MVFSTAPVSSPMKSQANTPHQPVVPANQFIISASRLLVSPRSPDVSPSAHEDSPPQRYWIKARQHRPIRFSTPKLKSFTTLRHAWTRGKQGNKGGRHRVSSFLVLSITAKVDRDNLGTGIEEGCGKPEGSPCWLAIRVPPDLVAFNARKSRDAIPPGEIPDPGRVQRVFFRRGTCRLIVPGFQKDLGTVFVAARHLTERDDFN